MLGCKRSPKTINITITAAEIRNASIFGGSPKNVPAIGSNYKHHPRSQHATHLRRKTPSQCTEVTNCASFTFRWPTVMGMTSGMVPTGLFPCILFNVCYIRCAMGYKGPSMTPPACNRTREVTLGGTAICSSQQTFQASPVAGARTQA